MTAEKTYLTVNEVAARLNVSVSSVWRWKRDGAFPSAVRVGTGSTRWRLSDIEAWEAELQTCLVCELPDLA
jgi:prophage regulatory protein